MNKHIVTNALYVGITLVVLFLIIYYRFPNIYNKMLGVLNTKEGFQTRPPEVRREIMRLWQRHIKLPTTKSPTTQSS